MELADALKRRGVNFEIATLHSALRALHVEEYGVIPENLENRLHISSKKAVAILDAL